MEKWLRSKKSFKIFHLGELKAMNQNCLWLRKDDGLLGLPGLMETCKIETNISYCGTVVVVCIRALCYRVAVSSFYLLVESALHPISCFTPCLLVL